MHGTCDKCGSKADYNFAINNGMCNVCIEASLEQLEAENEKLRERIKEAMAYIRLCHPIKYKEWLFEAEQALKGGEK